MGYHAKKTTNHEIIRRWAEERGGHPARVKEPRARDTGMVCIDFPNGRKGLELEEISWPEFFDAFERDELALLYQDATPSGEACRFNKLVSRYEG